MNLPFFRCHHVYRSQNNTYPFVSSIYAAIRETESQESMAHKLFQFIFTKSGADMIDESGYIAIKD